MRNYSKIMMNLRHLNNIIAIIALLQVVVGHAKEDAVVGKKMLKKKVAVGAAYLIVDNDDLEDCLHRCDEIFGSGSSDWNTCRARCTENYPPGRQPTRIPTPRMTRRPIPPHSRPPNRHNIIRPPTRPSRPIAPSHVIKVEDSTPEEEDKNLYEEAHEEPSTADI